MGLHGKIVHGAISGPTGAAWNLVVGIVSAAHLFDGSAPGRLCPARNDNRRLWNSLRTYDLQGNECSVCRQLFNVALQQNLWVNSGSGKAPSA